MTRRIAAALLGMVVAVLALVVVPLGVVSARHERATYRATALATARAVAGVAEENVADNEADPALGRYLRSTTRHDDGLVILDKQDRVTRSAGDVDYLPPGLAASARHGHTKTVWYSDDGHRRLAAAVPITTADGISGTVVLTRSARPVDESIRDLWWRLAGAGLAAVVLAGALGMLLARWVSRPLRRLERAAEDLGAGNLEVRAETVSGPVEVRRLAVAFNDMAGRLQTLVHDHRAVVADVSHQLRTPLAALRLRLELLRESSEPASSDEMDAALAETARLSRLVDGLLAVARAENAASPRVPVDLSSVAAERVAAWDPVASESRVTLSIEAADNVFALLGDGHLEQILDNLLDNAITASPADGAVTVLVTSHDGNAQVDIVDHGPGIPIERRSAVLHRFNTDHGGAGLGLAIVHRLATGDGGTVVLSPTDGGGLTVRLQWPATSRASRSSRKPTPAEAVSGARG